MEQEICTCNDELYTSNLIIITLYGAFGGDTHLHQHVFDTLC